MDATFFIVCLCMAAASAGAVYFYFVRRRESVKEPEKDAPVLPLAGGYEGLRDSVPGGRFFEDVTVSDSYQSLKERLFVLLETEKLYLSPEVRITDVARRLATNESHLSKMIKLKTGKNFCQLIHWFRVREAMRLYSLNTSLSITELREMVGFKSQTTFNTAFGRSTGYTPAEWCKEYLRKNRKPGTALPGRHQDK